MNSTFEASQGQGAPPMRSTNETLHPPPSPGQLNSGIRAPPPLVQCAPVAEDLEGAPPVPGAGGVTSGPHSFHTQNVGAMGPLTQEPAPAQVPFLFQSSFGNVMHPTGVYPQPFSSFGGQGCYIPAASYPPSQSYCGCPGFCLPAVQPQINQKQLGQKPVWHTLPQQRQILPDNAWETCPPNWSQGSGCVFSGSTSSYGPMPYANSQAGSETFGADSSSQQRSDANSTQSQFFQHPDQSAGPHQTHAQAPSTSRTDDDHASAHRFAHQHQTDYEEVDTSAEKNNGKRAEAVPEAEGALPDDHSVPANKRTADAEYNQSRRSAQEARAHSNMSSTQIIPGFPEGPLPGTRSDLKHRVNSFTTSVTTGAGAFSMVIASEPRVAKNRGIRQKLVCGQHKKMDCRFNVTYEETLQGWVLVNYHPHISSGTSAPTSNHHSHELVQSEVEAMASRLGHRIPDELLELAMGMALTCSIAAIDKALVANASRLGLPITWNYDYLRNHLQPSNRQKGLDTSNLMIKLEERAKQGLKFFVRTDAMDVIDRVFMEIEGGLETWARGGNDNVLLFDPTWGTNKQGFKLCCFCTIGSTGATEVIAVTLLAHETKEMFEWSFRCFASVFKVPPSSVFTDGDQQIAQAVILLSEEVGCSMAEIDSLTEAPWKGAQHNLCVYHLSQNLFTNVRPVFGNDLSNWRKCMNLFWRIAKETDFYSINTFEVEFEKVMEIVDGAADSDGKTRALKWLDELSKKRYKWCLRFIWSKCTWGVHSTQRSESIHASIKSVINRKPDITELLEEIDKHNTLLRSRRAVQQEILRMKQQHSGPNCAIVDFFSDKLVPYAFKLLLKQQEQALAYESNLDNDGLGSDSYFVSRRGSTVQEDDYIVFSENSNIDYAATSFDEDFGEGRESRSRYTTLMHCSCQYTIAFGGLPCRHMLHLHMRQQTTEEDFKQVLQNVKCKWLQSNDASVEKLAAKVRSLPDPNIMAPRCRPRQEMSKHQRIAVMNGLFDALCNLGCTSDGLFDKVCAGLEDLTVKLIDGDGQHSSASNQRSSQATAASVEEPVEKRISSKTDEMSLKAILGVSWKPRETPSVQEYYENDWWRSILGEHIAFKYEKQRSGGWWSGRIVAIKVTAQECIYWNLKKNEKSTTLPVDEADSSEDEAQSNPDDSSTAREAAESMEEGEVIIIFPADNSFMVIKLLLSTYTTSATAPKGSWMLLNREALGTDRDATVLHPEHQHKKGRPRMVRFTPSAGPMSRAPKRKKN